MITQQSWLANEVINLIKNQLSTIDIDVVKSQVENWQISSLKGVIHYSNNTVKLLEEEIFKHCMIRLKPFYIDRLLEIPITIEYNLLDSKLITNLKLLKEQCEEEYNEADANSMTLNNIMNQSTEMKMRFNKAKSLVSNINNKNEEIKSQAVSALRNMGIDAKTARQRVDDLLIENPLFTINQVLERFFKK